MIEKLKQVLAEVKGAPELATSLTEESRIMDDVGLDSLQLVTLLMKLEDEFELELDYENFNINHMESLSTLAVFLSERTVATT
jgi:acyl carrier protein